MRWLHFHHDPGWRMSDNGVFALHVCRCGARRTVWLARRMYGPIPAGFPPLKDRHGRQLADSGWVRSR
jgi:hypothetical protein